MQLTQGFTTKGIYDWRPYWEKFEFGNLEGKTILDVGAGDGFFSFMFEWQGAKVTALDIPNYEDCDSTKMGTRREWNEKTIDRGRAIVDFKTKFVIAKRLLAARVERIEMDLYDMSEENIGLFDIVFCGDTLLHLSDPVRAITRMRGVCKERTIISTPIHPMFGGKIMPLAHFKGADKCGAFWFPTEKCLRNMMIAGGFAKTQWIGSFKMAKEHAKVSIGVRGIVHGLV